MPDRRRDEDPSVLERDKTEKPKRYKVLIHNDDYTTMEFVIFILQTVFRHTPATSARLMLAIHRTGVGVAGVYSREIAETRLEKAMAVSRESGHPLELTMEPE